MIVTDGDRVLQIISNLLSNAFRWTPDGGPHRLALVAENGTISVAVADTGPGISPGGPRAHLPPVLVARRRRHRASASPIARELAVALGGRLELETEAGEGSRFGSCCRAGLPRDAAH